jgi:hypothetical protein
MRNILNFISVSADFTLSQAPSKLIYFLQRWRDFIKSSH